MARKLSYTDGRNLRHVLSPENYRAVEKFFTDRNIPMVQVGWFKPGMLSITMTVVELQRLGLTGIGVDEHFETRAKNDGKKLGYLETVDMQIEFLANMGIGQEDALIAYTLADIERLPRLWRQLSDAWRNGDLPGLDEVGAKPVRTEFPSIYAELVIDRNNAWLPQIVQMLETGPVELVLVGALHLSGKDGLLAQVSARGYELQQLQ